MTTDHPSLPPLDRALTDDELRFYVGHYLLHRKVNPDLPFQVGVFQHHVCGNNTPEAGQLERVNGGSSTLWNRVNTVCWEWVRLGLLVPGDNAGKFLPTDEGTTVLDQQTGEVAPLLRKGGIADELKRAGVSDVAVAYAGESQACFTGGLYQAAAVMLGVASEALVIDLVEVLLPLRKQFALPALKSRANVREQIDWLRDAFQQKGSAIRAALAAASVSVRWIDELGGLLAEANAIRLTRNSAGHPTVGQIERREILSLLVLFPTVAVALSSATAGMAKIAP